jgi:hypothetical protein
VVTIRDTGFHEADDVCRSARSSGEINRLRPHSNDYGLSPSSANMASPSDMVGPSPVTSNGTETTEIEDEVAEEAEEEEYSASSLESSPEIQQAAVCCTERLSVRH